MSIFEHRPSVAVRPVSRSFASYVRRTADRVGLRPRDAIFAPRAPRAETPKDLRQAVNLGGRLGVCIYGACRVCAADTSILKRILSSVSAPKSSRELNEVYTYALS